MHELSDEDIRGDMQSILNDIIHDLPVYENETDDLEVDEEQNMGSNI